MLLGHPGYGRHEALALRGTGCNNTALDAIMRLQSNLWIRAWRNYDKDASERIWADLAAHCDFTGDTYIYFLGWWLRHPRIARMNDRLNFVEGLGNDASVPSGKWTRWQGDKVMTLSSPNWPRRAGETPVPVPTTVKRQPMLSRRFQGQQRHLRPDSRPPQQPHARRRCFTPRLSRRLCATALDQWMGSDSAAVLGSKFDHQRL